MKLFIDGGCRGNGNLDISSREMFWVVCDQAGAALCEGRGRGGSNNIAELEAVVLALKWYREFGEGPLTIYTDSRNNLSWFYRQKVGKDINDRARVLRLKAEIEELMAQGKTVTLEWIPRERNLAGHYLEALGV